MARCDYPKVCACVECNEGERAAEEAAQAARERRQMADIGKALREAEMAVARQWGQAKI